LARPGGNITGLVEGNSLEHVAEQLQILKDALPQAAQVAVLLDPDLQASKIQLQRLNQVAPSLNLKLRLAVARQSSDLKNAFTNLEHDRPDAMFVPNSGINVMSRGLIVTLAAKNRLPVVSSFRETTEVGGLMSYGPDGIDLFRRAAGYVDRILKGKRAADLPVQAPSKYELVINLKTAKALGLTIPPSLLARADEVIE
jgi:putative ABC transport system substrate-binding protein